MYINVDGLGNIIAYNSQPQGGADERYVSDNHTLISQLLANLTNVKWVNNDMVVYTRPSVYHSWNGSAWVSDATLLAEARAGMWEKIKEYRQLRQLLGVKVNIAGVDYWIHSDAPSRELHLGLRADAICHLARTRLLWMEFPAFDPVQWKTMQALPNGQPQFVTVDYTAALAIYAADRAMTQSCFAKAEYHRVMMEASSDPLNYNYMTGWPLVYGED